MNQPDPSDDQRRAELRALLSDFLQVPLSPGQDERLLAELAPQRYDSLGVLDCVGLVEERFAVEIDIVDDDLRHTFATVASIADLVRRKRHDAEALGLGSL